VTTYDILWGDVYRGYDDKVNSDKL